MGVLGNRQCGVFHQPILHGRHIPEDGAEKYIVGPTALQQQVGDPTGAQCVRRRLVLAQVALPVVKQGDVDGLEPVNPDCLGVRASIQQ